MAKANMKTVSSYTVNLELTQDECETLRILFGYIGGHPQTSRRKFVMSIDEALSSVGVKDLDPTGRDGNQFLSGEIDFK